MSDLRPIDSIREAIDANPERRKRVDLRKEAMRQGSALAKLRHFRGLTQKLMAEGLSVSQANVSRIERSPDIYVSTLAGYVEALGGVLRLSAVFPGGHRYDLDSSGSVVDTGGPREGQPPGGIVIGLVSEVEAERLTLDLPGLERPTERLHIGERLLLIDAGQSIAIRSHLGTLNAFVEGVDSEARLVVSESESAT